MSLDHEPHPESTEVAASPRSRRSAMLVRIAVLASSAVLMLPGAWGNSATVVELAQLPAGMAAWQTKSLGIYRVCGPFSKLVYALPAHLAGVRIQYPASFDTDVVGRREWELGRLFQTSNPKQYQNIYRYSRILPILLTLLGGCLICEWSTRLFGTWPGIVSLGIWCWMSPVLGHGALVTSDMPSAVLTLLAARTFWSFLLRPRLATAIAAGATLGLAQATKFTLLVLDPCWAVLLIMRAFHLPGKVERDRSVQPCSLSRLAVLGMVMLGFSIVVIDASYGFKDVGFTLSKWQSGHSSLAEALKPLGESKATAWLFRVPLPIPIELVRGIDVQLADTERLQSAYLFGQTRLGGWWYWYAVAFLLKVSLPALALFGLALIRLPAAWRGRESVLWASLCVLMPALEVALVISATTGTGTNAAFRYLLPSLGLLCVIAGCAWSSTSRLRRAATISLLAWLMLDALLALPDHLGAQNEVAWVWSRYAKQPALIGDSLDWGQDLVRLGSWVRRHGHEGGTQVCVYGLGVGEPYGLEPPAAISSGASSPPSTYLAVSEGILYGDRISNDVVIGGGYPTLDPDLVEKLKRLPPFQRIGRTIRIYRQKDLTPTSSKKASTPPKTKTLASHSTAS